MVEELLAAINGLEDEEIIEVNKEKLLKLIGVAEGYDLSKYTELTADGLRVALDGAKEVYDNKAAVQEEVESAYNSLRQAIFNLRKTPDKSELEGLLGKAKAMDLSAYSEKTASAVKAAVAMAETVMADGNADQTEVDAAVAALEKAVAAANAEAGAEGKDNISDNDSSVSDQKDETSKTDHKVASDNKESNNTSKTAGNTAAKTGDAANAAVPAAVGLAAILGVLAAWKKK